MSFYYGSPKRIHWHWTASIVLEQIMIVFDGHAVLMLMCGCVVVRQLYKYTLIENPRVQNAS